MLSARQEDDRVTGIAISAALGIGIGVVAGLILWEWLGDVGTEPVRRAVRRVRSQESDKPQEDLESLEQAIKEAFGESPHLREFDLDAEALGDGIVDVTGVVPDEPLRELAGEIANQVPGADVVVNRVLVEGQETAPRKVPLALDKD